MDIFDHHFYFISNLEDLLRILNTSPRHLRDMKKSVYSAKVDECSEICNVLYSSFHSVTYVNLSKQFFLFFSTFSNKKLSSVTDHTISSRIKLADYEFNFLSLIFAEIFFISIHSSINFAAGRLSLPPLVAALSAAVCRPHLRHPPR